MGHRMLEQRYGEERHGPFIHEQVAWCGHTQDEQESKYETEKAGWNQMM